MWSFGSPTNDRSTAWRQAFPFARWKIWLPGRFPLARPQRFVSALRSRAKIWSSTTPPLDQITKQTLKDQSKGPRLRELAQQVIWWEPPKATLKKPARVIAQAMAAGTLDDAAFVEDLYGTDILRNVLADAPPGVFGPQAWSYWHHRLGYRRVPPLPTRVLT